MKKLSIIIPCYNMQNYIIKALDSILMQANQHEICDVYIIDDGSKDNSKHIVNEYIQNNRLDNFYLIEKKNGNWGSVINYAKNNLNIKSKYISILDADDYYDKELFNKISDLMEQAKYDLIFTGFWEIRKKNRITKGYLTPQRGNKEIAKKYLRFPSLIPLCKFFKTENFLKLDNLKEGVYYQDIILWNKFVDISSSFYYIKKPYGYYLTKRAGASSTQPFDERRINELLIIINSLISDNKYTNGYLMGLLMHLKKNTPKNLRKIIQINDTKKIKKFKLLWCPLGTRIVTKIGMRIYLFKILK